MHTQIRKATGPPEDTYIRISRCRRRYAVKDIPLGLCRHDAQCPARDECGPNIQAPSLEPDEVPTSRPPQRISVSSSTTSPCMEGVNRRGNGPGDDSLVSSCRDHFPTSNGVNRAWTHDMLPEIAMPRCIPWPEHLHPARLIGEVLSRRVVPHRMFLYGALDRLHGAPS